VQWVETEGGGHEGDGNGSLLLARIIVPSYHLPVHAVVSPVAGSPLLEHQPQAEAEAGAEAMARADAGAGAEQQPVC